MDLSARQIKILEAIINDYILTAEPIGSRTIEKKYDLGISSATIRNEMSDLEEMGLLLQPHTSSGRIPSDLGYRMFVNSILEYRTLTKEEQSSMRKQLSDNITRVDNLLLESAKMLADLTRYPTVVSEPFVETVSLKHVQLVPVDIDSFAVVLVTNSNIVKHYQVEIKNVPPYEDLLKITNMVNEHLAGIPLEAIDHSYIPVFTSILPAFSHIYPSILKIILDSLETEESLKMHTAGINQLLAFPEFSNAQKAREIFEALEEPDTLFMLLKQNKDAPFGVVIGAENDLVRLKDCSIIRADYGFGGHFLGSIGIIGPTRMDYGELISVLKGLVEHIEAAIHHLS